MYDFAIKEGLRRLGRKMGRSVFNDTLNPDEAYADRIMKDFGINWYDAYEAYHQMPQFWEKSYNEDPVGYSGGPAMAPSEKTSRLPAATAPSKGVSSQASGGIWDRLFPNRASLRDAERKWRD